VADVMAQLAANEDTKIRAVNEKHGDDHGVKDSMTENRTTRAAANGRGEVRRPAPRTISGCRSVKRNWVTCGCPSRTRSSPEQ